MCVKSHPGTLLKTSGPQAPHPEILIQYISSAVHKTVPEAGIPGFSEEGVL